MKFGKHTYGRKGIKTFEWGEGNECTVGAFCSIAKGCTIFLGGYHNSDWISTYPFGHVYHKVFGGFENKGHPKKRGNVVIGNDVWVGSNVVIMAGVTIGDGAIIANGSHVVRDVKPYTVVGGNPAELIKYRFTKEQSEKLLKIAWWGWEDAKIKENMILLCSDNIDKFIDKHSI